MPWRNATGGCMLAAISFCANPAFAGDPWLRDGTYEIITRLELPHLERYAVDSVHRVCFTGGWATKAIPAPVESANHPFTPCAADHIERGAGTIEYDIACPGRDSARAHASYRATDNGFDGRVAMVMGGKNMTMTEVVRGRRLGACNETAELAPIRF
ncbi:MAG TPA: DUF3617 family protein [Roseiarcus sp.]